MAARRVVMFKMIKFTRNFFPVHRNVLIHRPFHDLTIAVNYIFFKKLGPCIDSSVMYIQKVLFQSYMIALRPQYGNQKDSRNVRFLPLQVGIWRKQFKFPKEWSSCVCFRPMSSGSDGTDRNSKPPLLMNFNPVAWPSMLLTLKNWIITKLIIQPYFDGEFNIKEFIRGAKQALVTVSSHLSRGELDSLHGLVAEEAVKEIQRNYSLLSMKQRQEMQVKPADIYFCFPYQIGIILDDSTQRRFAEITVVYHCFYGIEDVTNVEKNFDSVYQNKDQITVCNYRFIREYTKGVQSNWIVNRLCHFKTSHLE